MRPVCVYVSSQSPDCVLYVCMYQARALSASLIHLLAHQARALSASLILNATLTHLLARSLTVTHPRHQALTFTLILCESGDIEPAPADSAGLKGHSLPGDHEGNCEHPDAVYKYPPEYPSAYKYPSGHGGGSVFLVLMRWSPSSNPFK